MMRLCIVLLVAALVPADALAGTPGCGGLIRVTTLRDEDRPEGCTPEACSLREAIALANACRGGDTTLIALPHGRYGLRNVGFTHPRTPPPTTRARGDSAMIVTGRIRIEGENAVIARDLDAVPFRIFDVAPEAWLALVSVELSGGLGGAEAGGGIHVREGGRLLLDRARVSGAARFGGGIYAAGTVSMQDVQIEGGQAERGGGLFVAPAGTARINRSEFTRNLADGMAGFGGAIEAQGVVTIRYTTFTGNAARHGAAISVWRPGRVRLVGGVIADNSASANSGAFELLDGDEVAGARFERNAPRDCVFRYVQDRETRGCAGATSPLPAANRATASGKADALAER